MIVLIDIYNKYDKVLCHQNVVCLLYSNSNDSFPFYIRLLVSSITDRTFTTFTELQGPSPVFGEVRIAHFLVSVLYFAFVSCA